MSSGNGASPIFSVCRHCGTPFRGAPRSYAFGLRATDCARCSRATAYPMSRGVRALFWILAVFSVIGVVAANATLHQGASWGIGGIGVAAFIALFVDAKVSMRAERYALWNHEQAPRENTVGYIALLSGAATVAIIATVLGGVAVAGMNNGNAYTAAASAEPSDGEEPEMDVVFSEDQLCSGMDTISVCVEKHQTMYESVCTMPNRTGLVTAEKRDVRERRFSYEARQTCSELKEWINAESPGIYECGPDCRPDIKFWDSWGWQYMHPSVEDISLPPTPRCYFLLGELSIGDCSG